MATPPDAQPADGRGEPRKTRDLDVVQRWFQSVITHPSGVAGGVESPAARDEIPIRRAEIEEVILPSQRLGSEDRLAVYANAYYGRLLECLGESYPVVKTTVGEDVFNLFAFGYLQAYPSRSYTLNRLDEDFPRYLREERPASDLESDTLPVDWPDFLVDLTRLEWTTARVYDGPGTERIELLGEAELRSIAPENWPTARLELAPCVHLLEFRFPVNAYFTAVRKLAADAPAPPIPEPAAEYVAVTRRDYVVWRYPLAREEYVLLGALASGETVGESIARAAAESDLDDEQLAASLGEWFRIWVAQGFFVGVTVE